MQTGQETPIYYWHFSCCFSV